MKYLGIDYGDRRVGVAVASGPLAEPLDTFLTEESVQKIKEIVETNSIDEIVIGDCPGEFMQEIKNIGIPVHRVDETLSSHDARQSLLHTTRKKRKEIEHAVSAAIILQNWLDTTSPLPSP